MNDMDQLEEELTQPVKLNSKEEVSKSTIWTN